MAQFFGLEGRISRMGYLGAAIGITLLMFVAYAVTMNIFYMNERVGAALAIIWSIIIIWLIVMVHLKRLRDANMPRLLILLLPIPLIGYVIVGICLFASSANSDQTSNEI